ncbi:MAG: hypothetical protein V4722_19870 [Bacteroidota bacterium]
MHFEKVQLPSTVVAELYKQSLVVLEDVQPVGKNVVDRGLPPTAEILPIEPQKIETAPVPAKKEDVITAPATMGPVTENDDPGKKETGIAPIKYLGGFGKQVAIVVTEHFHPHIADEDLAFLSKMLAACKLSMNDVAIINVVSNPQSAQLWQLMPAKVMLMFDVDPGSLGLPFRRPHFEVQEWSGSSFLVAPELSTFRIGAEPDVKMLKTKLWLCLQKIFLGM